MLRGTWLCFETDPAPTLRSENMTSAKPARPPRL